MIEHRRIRAEAPQVMRRDQERAVLAAAFAANPNSAMLRRRLAYQCMTADAFDDVLELLGGMPATEQGYAEHLMIAEAHLYRETLSANRLAREAADRAVERADSARQRATALASRGKAEVRLGDITTACATFIAALELDPFNKDACKRLASLYLKAGDSSAVIALVDGLLALGSCHSRALAARTLALAKQGDIEAARGSVDHAAFRHRQQLPPPPGWSDLEAFNTALAAELETHPGMTYDRYGTASEHTWRIDEPLAGNRPIISTLVDALTEQVEALIARLPEGDHPWIAATPKRGILHCWCVITESTGFETWHVHQFGWMSGVYYVRVPDSIASGSDEGGCLAFGIPEDEVGEDVASAFGREIVRPQSGSMLLFPSHAYHRTFAHGLAERRICVAFDIWPE